MNYEVFLDIFRICVLSGISIAGIRILSMQRNSYTEKTKTISQMPLLTVNGTDDNADDHSGRGRICLVFYILAMLCMLFDDVYWLIYDILRPDTRLPFAANEFAEWAFFMMLGASVSYHNRIRLRHALIETLFTILFAAANVALWIGWSGEWLQDILTGPVFAYFLCSVVYKLKNEDVISGIRLVLLGITAFGVVSAEAVTFFLDEAMVIHIERVCFIVLLIVTVILLLKTIITIAKKEAPGKYTAYAFAFFAWSTFFAYLSEETHWLVASSFSGIGFIVMFIGIMKETCQK